MSDIGARWRARRQWSHEWLDAVCVAADPQSRDARRQPGDGIADRRRGAAAARARCRRCTSPARNGQPRRIPLASFFTGYRRTVLAAPARSSRLIEIPQPLPGFVRFYKIAKRRLDDISTRGGGDGDRSGHAPAGVRRARFASWRRRGHARCWSREAEDVVTGQLWNESAGRARAAGARPRADADERPSRVGGLPPRGVQAAWSRSSSGSHRHDASAGQACSARERARVT